MIHIAKVCINEALVVCFEELIFLIIVFPALADVWYEIVLELYLELRNVRRWVLRTKFCTPYIAWFFFSSTS